MGMLRALSPGLLAVHLMKKDRASAPAPAMPAAPTGPSPRELANRVNANRAGGQALAGPLNGGL